jgi:putative hydrolase of the HAD superfamily
MVQSTLSGIKAVIFDYGEVLSAVPSRSARQRMADLLGTELDAFISLYRHSRLPYDRGDISPQDYWQAVAAKAGTRVGAGEIDQLRAWDVEMWSNLNPEMMHWARSLRAAGVRIGMLSNMHPDMVAHVRRWDWPRDFDCLTLSCEIRTAKPDATIYEHCLRSLNVRAAEALFLDDVETNVEAARKLGMSAIPFRSTMQLRDELQQQNFAPLPQAGRATAQEHT